MSQTYWKNERCAKPTTEKYITNWCDLIVVVAFVAVLSELDFFWQCSRMEGNCSEPNKKLQTLLIFGKFSIVWSHQIAMYSFNITCVLQTCNDYLQVSNRYGGITYFLQKLWPYAIVKFSGDTQYSNCELYNKLLEVDFSSLNNKF